MSEILNYQRGERVRGGERVREEGRGDGEGRREGGNDYACIYY